MTVSVLMPVGGTECHHRQQAHAYVADHYRTNHPDWELVEGHCGERWSKGSAIDDAYRQTTGDVIVLADADSFVLPHVLCDMVTQVAFGVAWALPHRIVYRLTEAETDSVIAGKTVDPRNVVRQPYVGPYGGGITVMTRAAYIAVNGVDDRFYGWGGEDICLGMALWAITGRFARGESPLYHLWHPHPAPDLRGSPESEALVARYKAVRTDVAGMRALVREHRGPNQVDDADRHALPRHRQRIA